MPTLAIETVGLYTLADAQVPRHPPDDRRDTHPDRRDALAHGGAAPGARGQRQARAPRRLRGPRLPAGSLGPLRAAASLHRRNCLWRRY